MALNQNRVFIEVILNLQVLSIYKTSFVLL